MTDRRPDAAFFARVTGQAMNVGDSVLRRGYIRSLRSLGRAHLFVRQMPQGYIDGLGVGPDDMLYRSEEEWKRAFRQSAEERPTTWAFNAGEMQFSRFYAQELATSLPLNRLARKSGGESVMLGVSMRTRSGSWSLPVKQLLRTVDRVSWRDAPSREWTGVGAVAPDWAFLEGHETASAETDADRPYLALSLRGDRGAPSGAWFEAVQALAARHSLEVIALAQVEVDTALMAHVAERLNCSLVGMPSGISHLEQEEVVRELYRRSSAIDCTPSSWERPKAHYLSA
jgi:hypothetical protein